MDILFYAILLIAFVGFFGMVESVFMLWGTFGNSEVKRLKQRLKLIAGENPTVLDPRFKRGAFSKNEAIDLILKRFKKQLKGLDALLRQAGTNYTVAEFLMAIVISGLIVMLFALLLGAGFYLSVLLGLPGMSIPWLFLLFKKKARLTKIESQLPDALDMLSRAMRAGHSFSSAMKAAATEGQEPISSEFRAASDEINFGASIREGILSLANRVDSMDMRFFALAVLIQSETGGNLSGLLSELAGLIRERLKLRRTVQVLSAEGRLSALVLGSLPVAFAGVLSFVNLDYLAFFWRDPSGPTLLKFMAVLMFVGVVWIKKLTTIRV